jgi:hypothetical protein
MKRLTFKPLKTRSPFSTSISKVPKEKKTYKEGNIIKEHSDLKKRR